MFWGGVLRNSRQEKDVKITVKVEEIGEVREDDK
jgi:hypothetical protein